MTELTKQEWEVFLQHYPQAHLLQSASWGELKSEFGWDVTRLRTQPSTSGEDYSSGAQILFKPLPLGFSLAYIPKGPLTREDAHDAPNDWNLLWPLIDRLCRARKAVFLKVEPDLWAPEGNSKHNLSQNYKRFFPGFHLSLQSVQPPRTLMIDLRGDEEQVLGRMKQKTRYNIRLALKKGVIVSPSADLDMFYDLISITADRADFGVHSKAYYQRAYDLFHPKGEAEILMAEYQGEPLAAIMVFAKGKRAWYLYGASGDKYRERMPTYLLQWEGMRWARSRGCEWYDLWGVPDVDQDELERNFTNRSNGLWGVYRFKRGFGGLLRRSIGPYDRVYKPLLYSFYRLISRLPAQTNKR